MDENPYRPPVFSETPEVVGSSRTEAEIRAFVGRNARYYLRKWPVADEDDGPARGFNWAAFLLSGLWLPYRKMYRVTLIFIAVIVGTSILAESAAYAGLASATAMSALDRLSGIFISVICGIYGNSWYFAHTKRSIAKIRAMGLPDDTYFAELARRGGTSLLASLGFILLLIVVTFIALDLIAAIADTGAVEAE
jgi:hypothetical protein